MYLHASKNEENKSVNMYSIVYFPDAFFTILLTSSALGAAVTKQNCIHEVTKSR